MFTTLVESRAVRKRSTRGAMVSVLLHGTLIAGAIALTHPGSVDAKPKPSEKRTIYIAPPRAPKQPVQPNPQHTPPSTHFAPPNASVLTITVPTTMPTSLPTINLDGPALPTEQIQLGVGVPTGSPIGSHTGREFTSGDIVNENMVDRAPHIVGNAPVPRYPNALRESGVAGRVVARFVVDTLGRAEMDGVTIVETSHMLFSDAVKNVLGQYHFSPGAVGGRKVRTMVQVPFTFTLR